MFESGYYCTEELKQAGFKSLGENVLIAKNCTIVNPQNISIGSNVRIDGYCSLIAGEISGISIGSFVHIGSYCFLSGGESIIMDDFSALSQSVKIYTRSDDYTGETLTNPTVPLQYKNITSGSVHIQKHCLIGSGCVILPNVIVGEGVSVGALSLLTLNLKPWYVYYGNPVRKLKARSKKLLELESKLVEDIKSEK